MIHDAEHLDDIVVEPISRKVPTVHLSSEVVILVDGRPLSEEKVPVPEGLYHKG